MIKRPKCGRCKGPLDIWHDPDTGITLPGNDVVKLEKWYGPIRID